MYCSPLAPTLGTLEIGGQWLIPQDREQEPPSITSQQPQW